MGGQRQFRAPLAEEIQPENPLLDAVVPVVEGQSAGEHLLGQQAGGGVGGGRLDPARADGQVAEAELLLGIDAFGARRRRRPAARQAMSSGNSSRSQSSSIAVARLRRVWTLLSLPSTSRTSAATSRGLFWTTLSRASVPRRPWTSSQRSVPESSRRATRSLKPSRMHFCKASSGTSRWAGIEALAPGDVEELLEQRADLPGGGGMNAQPAAGVEPEVAGGSVLPGAHQEPEVAAGLFTQQVLALPRGVGIHVAQEEVAALGEGGEQAGLIDAAVILRRQQHAGVTRVQREGEHLAPNAR